MSEEIKKGGLLDGANSETEWITVENGEHVPVKKGQSKAEAIAGHFSGSASETIKMTPAEKVASVHISFDKDNILPELNEDDLVKLGVNSNKPVLLKKNIIDRNQIKHYDLSQEDGVAIIGKALYSPAEIFRGNRSKSYYTFVKPMRLSPKDGKTVDNGLVLLDVSETKDNFEIVHWHWIREKDLKKLKKK